MNSSERFPLLFALFALLLGVGCGALHVLVETMDEPDPLLSALAVTVCTMISACCVLRDHGDGSSSSAYPCPWRWPLPLSSFPPRTSPGPASEALFWSRCPDVPEPLEAPYCAAKSHRYFRGQEKGLVVIVFIEGSQECADRFSVILVERDERKPRISIAQLSLAHE